MVKQSARLDPGTEVSVYLLKKKKERVCTAVWISCWRCTGPHFFPAPISGHISGNVTKVHVWVCVCVVHLENNIVFLLATCLLLCGKATVCPLPVMP